MRSVAIIAVSRGVRRASWTSSAWRWASRRDRHDRIGTREELVAVRPDDEQRPVRELPGQRLEDLERQVVRPVEVLEGDDRGAVAGDVGQQLGHVEHEQPSAPMGVAAGRRPVVEALLEGPPSSSKPG